ncbi:MAG: hypothetical protein AB3N15_18505 [Paracoccaceae bacterium]
MSDKTAEAVTLAPVCLFAFNRPDHTRRTLDALAASPLAQETDLIVYLDGPRTEEESPLVEKVASIIQVQNGFASVRLNRRDANVGLAESIRSGVTLTMQEYGRAIVVEDDIVTSQAFLSYMNQALDRYENEKKVWHIAGYNEPIAANRDMRGAAFWRLMSCWGWASWADRWQHFERQPQTLINRFRPDDIRRFNLDGVADFWSQVVANDSGELRTWAIFWYATIFLNDGLCLSPHLSYCGNIGFDGSGTHSGPLNTLQAERLNQDMTPPLPDEVVEDLEALARLKAYYTRRPTRLERLRRRCQKLARKFRR